MGALQAKENIWYVGVQDPDCACSISSCIQTTVLPTIPIS